MADEHTINRDDDPDNEDYLNLLWIGDATYSIDMRSVCHIRETVLWERNMGKELLDWDGLIEGWIGKDE